MSEAERFGEWTEDVLVMASLLPDDLADLDDLTAEQRDRVVRLIQRIKAAYD